MKDISIVIPSLNPDNKFINLIDKLIESDCKDIIVVNDGSKEEHLKYFEIAEEKGCVVLKHSVNLGKGRALKTAFNYFLNNKKNKKGVVTVDADGQHEINDIISCMNTLSKSSDSLVLGCREFDNDSVPFRSKFGNILTRNVFNMLVGIKITDTQTGLRGIPRDYIEKLMNIYGEKFEFETNMLIETKNNNVPIKEVPIKTIYIEENKSSHFNPLVDSLKIYKLFFKFIISSASSFIIDIVLFSMLISMFKGKIITSTIIARIISSTYNYLINKNAVFKSKAKASTTLMRYFSLCVTIMILSSVGVDIIYSIVGKGAIIFKIVVDAVLFLLSFKLQRDWVFGKRG